MGVLLGRADGTMVEGPGTDGGLTTDHKPDNADERARIERTGGTVENVMGVARVNGDLAVSRAFGDAQHKEIGGPGQEDHPVSAAPEFTTMRCDPTDFLMLVCDGISEGDFPNREVVRLAANELKASGDTPDLAAASVSVCRKALQSGSKDNLSCMIVALGGGEGGGLDKELIPGPFDAPRHAGFRKAYAAMAEHVGLTLEQAVELRYDAAQKEDPVGSQAELSVFGSGPPAELASGSAERVAWFRQWLEQHAGEDPPNHEMPQEQLLAMLEGDPRLMAEAQAQGIYNRCPRRKVLVGPVEELRAAMEANAALKWNDRLTDVCGKRGLVLGDDVSDGTSKVRFLPPLRIVAWLPTCVLTDVEDNGRKVVISSLEVLRPAMEGHPDLKWNERLKSICGTQGTVIQDDDDGTSQVRVVMPSRMTVWLPNSALTDVEVAADPEPDSKHGAVGDRGDESAAVETGEDASAMGGVDAVAQSESKEEAAPLAKRQKVE